ncbi:DNA-binding transcriptional regulator, LacI/PurR family [Clostridium sp. USBA 49]|uniref:LacI family DNA-binding transcriptional regulator n=1 Tax=Clostridium sp. USBA 49 TaxID=1881060 RepID=UPI00099AE743|nr:LacI family DNA-binding transcriptional regulator [Clostridium sp. USBA 49]SKA73008.1 DNA-binding transcriptional regulator, LacI/PurR family [Clostridium sp. USBA 49]
MRKATLKDIAKEVGVSVATVSYVLNGNPKQSISDGTKDKIIQVANKLNYVPNLAARSLVMKKSGLIGVLIVKSKQNKLPIMTNHYYKLLENIEEYLADKGYHVLSSNIDLDEPNLDIIKQRDLEGVLVVDVDKSIFYNISIKFTVPIILIDTYLDDILFHKVIVDYVECAKKIADLYKVNINDSVILIPKLNSKDLMNELLEKNKDKIIYFVDSKEKVEDILKKYKDRHFIVVSEELGILMNNYIDNKNLSVICINDQEYLLKEDINKVSINLNQMAKVIVNILFKYIDGNFKNNKYTIIKAD